MAAAATRALPQRRSRRLWTWAVIAVAGAAVATLATVWIDDPAITGAAVVAGVCLLLWLSEVVPPYVPTLVL